MSVAPSPTGPRTSTTDTAAALARQVAALWPGLRVSPFSPGVHVVHHPGAHSRLAWVSTGAAQVLDRYTTAEDPLPTARRLLRGPGWRLRRSIETAREVTGTLRAEGLQATCARDTITVPAAHGSLVVLVSRRTAGTQLICLHTWETPVVCDDVISLVGLAESAQHPTG